MKKFIFILLLSLPGLAIAQVKILNRLSDENGTISFMSFDNKECFIPNKSGKKILTDSLHLRLIDDLVLTKEITDEWGF